MAAEDGFAGWLREQRYARDLTQEALAEQVGCSVTTIRKLEAGARQPSASLRRRVMAAVEGTTSADFPGEDGFGAWMRSQRRARDWTQAELAQQIGYTPDAIHLIEVGKMRPSKPAASKLAEVLGIPSGERPAWLRWARSRSPSHLAASFPTTVTPLPCSKLPTPSTPLVGRARLVTALQAQLRDPALRLLTLTGPPGVGKTRLTLAVAAAAPTFPDGVCWVSLSPLSDPALVPTAIAQALGVTEGSAGSLLPHLIRALQSRHLLLVLDNFEHVRAAASLLSDLLGAAPRLKILVTSRAVLNLYGEHIIEVPPLDLPILNRKTPLDRIVQAEAIQLFVARAQAVQPAFVLTAAQAPIIAAICVHLDGLPLAIELAAARLRLLSPQALLEQLRQRLPLLTHGPQDRPARHQTLRAALSWSYALLSADERTLFARLGIFRGGATLEAIRAVCYPPDTPAARVMEELAALVDQSLPHAEPGKNNEVRFRLLETIREYAVEQLAQSGEEAALHRRHASYYLELAEAVEPALLGREQLETLTLLDADNANLRVALRWLLEHGEPELAGRLAVALWRFWDIRGYLSEGLRWLDAVLATPETLPLPLQAKLLHGAGGLAWSQSDIQRADHFFAACLRVRQQLGDRAGVAGMFYSQGMCALNLGDALRAAALAEESRALYAALDDQRGVANALQLLGIAHRNQGAYAQATTCLELSLALRREQGSTEGIAATLASLGQIARAQGDLARAGQCYGESLVLFQHLGHKANSAMVLHYLGEVARRDGALEQARDLLTTSLRLYQELDRMQGIAECLVTFGCLAADEGQSAAALRLFGAASAIFTRLGTALDPMDRAEYEQQVSAARAVLGAASLQEWGVGQAMTSDVACALALAGTAAPNSTSLQVAVPVVPVPLI